MYDILNKISPEIINSRIRESFSAGAQYHIHKIGGLQHKRDELQGKPPILLIVALQE